MFWGKKSVAEKPFAHAARMMATVFAALVEACERREPSMHQRREVADIGLRRIAIDCTLADKLATMVDFWQQCYPDWVFEHLTPRAEVAVPTYVREREVILVDVRELTQSPDPTGHEVYKAIEKTMDLDSAMSVGHLVAIKEEPLRELGLREFISKKRGYKRLFGWASVVRSRDNKLYVPYLYCCEITNWDINSIGWKSLDEKFDEWDIAGFTSPYFNRESS